MSKYLRMPNSAQFDDDDDDSSSEEEEEEETTMNNRSDQKKASLSSSEDDDDDDDDNEEGDDDDEDSSSDEEEIQTSRKRKPKSNSSSSSSGNRNSSSASGGINKRKTKKAKKAGSSFFDEEAEADDDDEEEEIYGDYHDPHDVVKKHYTKEDIERENMDKEMERAQRRIDMRRNREGDFLSNFQNHSDVDVAKQIEKRHIQSRKYVRDRTDYMIDEREDEELSEMPQSYQAAKQQSVLPSVSDPSLWMFSCPNGKEDELVYQIMNKSIAYAKAGKPLGITSAVAAQSKGRVYVESFSEPALIEAVKGIRNLMQYTMRLVPISDMTTVMTVVPKKKPVKKGEWVRLTRGHYKGDLALVKDVTAGNQKAIIQCVPRIDIQAFGLSVEEQRIRRRTVRPPQKFFNESEIRAHGLNVDRKKFAAYGNRTYDFFEGNYYHDGYLLKEVNVGTMIKPYTDDDPPTLDELQRFRQSGRKKHNDDDDPHDYDEENEGSKQAGSLLEELSEITGASGLLKDGSAQGGGLLIGDTIEVVEGDLVGLRGKIISMDGTTVKVQPDTSTGVDLGGLNEVEFLSSQIRKHIPVGAHVKVTSGRYANETGTVVAVEQLEGDSSDFTAVVLTDMTHKEISVRVSQVKESAEIASGQDKLAGYELHDLVVLTGGGSANEVGVIVRVGREDFTVMNHQGIVREARPEDLRGKRNSHSSRAVALDAQGSQIRVGDSISVMEGPHKGKTATIKRMNRAQLFLYSQTRHEHAGIFVVRGRSCVLAGSSKKSNRNAAGDALNSPYASPRSQNSGGGGPGGRGGGRNKDDTLIQKTVRIQSGKWKGYLGCVSDANPTHVQVELHSRMKKIMVARDRVAVIGDRFGATDNPERTNGNPYSNNMIGAPTTPFLGVGGGATPMHGTATPMHDGFSSVSDVWRPDGGSGGAGGEASSSMIGDDESNNAIADESSSTWTAGGGGGDQGSLSSSTNAFGEVDSSTKGGGGWGSNDDTDSTMWTPSTSGGADDDSSLASDMTPRTYGTSHDDHATNSSAMVDSAIGEVPAWFMDHVCVTVTSKDNAKGYISEVSSGDGIATVILDDSGEKEKVRYTELALVKPVEHDMVVVTGGSDVGVEGELVCIDNTDAILKDSSEEYKIVDFVFLAKIIKKDDE